MLVIESNIVYFKLGLLLSMRFNLFQIHVFVVFFFEFESTLTLIIYRCLIMMGDRIRFVYLGFIFIF